jgi:hypothetical protein
MDVVAAIQETEERARKLLKKDKKTLELQSIGAQVFQFVLRKATVDDTRSSEVFNFRGTTYTYDAGCGMIYIEGARAGSADCDRVVCCAAAVMLNATHCISDPELRTYVEDRLTAGMPAIGKRGRGRSKADNAPRDLVIVARLILPLLDRFDATRNPATKGESACSIVQKALANIGIHMGEDAVERVWEKLPSSMRKNLLPAVPNK